MQKSVVLGIMVSIYDYTSYREFLCDYYTAQKECSPSFSYQVFANKAGFKTKTFIYKVIKGEKALSRGSVLKISKALKLKKREIEYFEAMVHFNNAGSIDEKEFYFHRLQSLSKNHRSGKIRKNQYTYFDKWYYVVLRELVTLLDWQEDYSLLAKAVDPPITTKQAKDAVTLLVELGLIKKTAKGQYMQVQKNITTGENFKSLLVQKFQKNTISLALNSLDRHKKHIRDISSLTVGVSHESFLRIRDEIKSFREKIVEIIHGEDGADRVYQINFQAFPLSQIPKGKKR